jgi:hypothetical protein
MVLGGGMVLEASLFKFRRSRSKNTIEYLNALMAKNLPEVVRRYMNLFPKQPVTADNMARYSGLELSAIHEAIHQGISSKEIMPIGDQGFYLIKQFAIEALEEVKQRIQKIISEKKSFTLSDSTEILGFGRTKGAPIFDFLDFVGFTKREGNIRTLK